MLVSAKADQAIRERSGKGGLIRPSNTGSSKTILTLLAKVVALYIGFTIVEVWEPGFERSSLRASFQATCLCFEKQIYAEFCDSLEVFFGVSGGSQSRNWSSRGWGIRSSNVTWCGSLFFRACGLLWLTETNRACWNVFLTTWALCHCCGAEAGIDQQSFSKQTGWPVRYGEIRIVNGTASRLVSWSPINTTSSAKGSAQCERTKLRVQEELGEVKGQSADWLEADWVIVGWSRATCQRDKGRSCNDLGPKVDREWSRAMMMGTKMDRRAAKQKSCNED